MTVIYMANRQYYVYKTILGRENLNNVCQPSKGAGVGWDPGILFPLLPYLSVFCQDALLWNNTKCPQKCLWKPHRPEEDTITLLWQPEFSKSRAAPSSVTRGNTYQAGKQWSQASSPSSSTPLLKITSNEPLISHTGAGPTPNPTLNPPTSAWTPANSLPSPVLGLVFLSMRSSLSPSYKLFQGFATTQRDKAGHRNGLQLAQSLWVYVISRTMLIIPLKQHR